MMKICSLAGLWHCSIPGMEGEIRLPGTLDEGGIGFPDRVTHAWHPDAAKNDSLSGGDVIATRFTRRVTFEGAARISRRICAEIPADRQILFRVERARNLRLEINGQPVPDMVPPTLATPRCFDVTGLLTGEDEIAFVSDNTYPGWPGEDIITSSAATDETQTNWNGLLGEIGLFAREKTGIGAVRVYPHGRLADVRVEILGGYRKHLLLESEAFFLPVRIEEAGEWIRNIPLRRDVRRWDMDEGILYDLTVSGEGIREVTVSFGVRDIGTEQGFLTLNGRKIFLRGEANCAVFPETGYEPMEVEAWTEILNTYRSYGVNCMRFHSHVPPEAAFTAADRMGMLMQPELNCWQPRTAFDTPAQEDYYRNELEQTILWLANHPSFVMLTLGNELHAHEEGHRAMNAMLAMARALDPTRLYANGSNVHYGAMGADEASDFYTSNAWYDRMIRATSAGMQGYLNREAPDARHNYDREMAEIRKTWRKPVFSFEVGQYEVLPDFDELEAFHGVTRADNYELIRRHVQEKNLTDRWKEMVEATGELSLLCYREEVEAALRTKELGGISLLGLQDFPGQGTALVGMLNSHLRPKPFSFASPERFRAFFRDVLPLALMDRYCFTAGEELTIPVKLANHGREDISGAMRWSLGAMQGELPCCVIPQGELGDAGSIRVTLPAVRQAQALTLRLKMEGHENAYPLWVYPEGEPVCPERVYCCVSLDEKAEKTLAEGGRVLLSVQGSISTQFSTDFWSVGTFPVQSGAMGQLIEADHPVFRHFPTAKHTDWQWHAMAGQGAIVVPEGTSCIITELDSYAYLRPMAQLLECRCGGGRLMISTLGLEKLRHLPEAKALQGSIWAYMDSEAFLPGQELTVSQVRKITG